MPKASPSSVEQTTFFDEPRASSALEALESFVTVRPETFALWPPKKQWTYLAERDENAAALAEDDEWWQNFHLERAAYYRSLCD